MAEEAVAAATDGLRDGRETSGRGDLYIPDELVPLYNFLLQFHYNAIMAF